MYDGWGYVLATYLLVAATIGVWLWMILSKLARAKAARTALLDGSTPQETPRG
jgi:hypothetical protein